MGPVRASALPPSRRVVALEGGRGDATPCAPGPAAAVLDALTVFQSCQCCSTFVTHDGQPSLRVVMRSWVVILNPPAARDRQRRSGVGAATCFRGELMVRGHVVTTAAVPCGV